MAARPQHTPAYRRLCDLLRRMREEAGMTQRDLAKKMRFHHTMVHRSETGDRRIDPVEFIAWCRGCDLDPSEQLRLLDRGSR